MKRYLGPALALSLLASVANAGPTAIGGSSGCYDPAVEVVDENTWVASQIDRSQSGITCSAAGGGSRSETQAFLGLTFSFEHGNIYPKISAGVRKIEVRSDDSVSGAEINLSSSLTDLGKDTTLRLIALDGHRNALLNLGVGYDFDKTDWLINAGLQLPQIRVYADYLVKNKQINPSIELNSYGRIDPVGSACNGTEVTPDELLQTLVSKEVLTYGGTDLEVVNGDIYSGSVTDIPDHNYEWTFSGTKNPLVFNSSNKTCLTLAPGAKADLD